MSGLRVRELHVFPVKGCRGVALDQLELGARGPLHDREWMVVDAQTGQMITQRDAWRLATLDVALEPDALRLRDENGEVAVALDHGPLLEATVWGDVSAATDCGDEVAAWLEARLSRSVRLVRVAESNTRNIDTAYYAPGSLVGFADGFPLLVTTMSSLAALNELLDAAVPMSRFRANIVVEGEVAAWAEDTWGELVFPNASVALVKGCTRCKVTTLDQSTGEAPVAKEPLATLTKFRRGRGEKAIFGQNGVVTRRGVVALGDRVVANPKLD